MAAAAPIKMSFSFSVALLLLISSPLVSLHALDVSSTCPNILTPSTLKDYKRPSNDTLLVVVPWKTGFEQFVKFDAATCLIDGFSVQVFNQALWHLPVQKRFPYQFVLYGDGEQTPPYDGMIEMVVNGDVDAVVADLTITRERMERVGFTMPYLPSTLVMVTPFEYGSAGTLWDFLQPFSAPLWLTLLGSFVFTGAVLYLLENRNPDFSFALKKPPSSRDSSSHGRSSPSAAPAPAAAASASTPTPALSAPRSAQTDAADLPSTDPFSLQRPGPPIFDQASHKRRILNAYWFTSLCVFAAQQESVRTHLGRFVTVMWLFVMLIFNSSYTASLASLLSAQKKYPTIEGFQDLLSDRNISVGYQAGSFMKEYMKKILINKNRLKIFTSETGYIRALNEGNGKLDGVGAVLDELPYIQILLQSQCFYTRGPDDDKLPSWGGFAFAFRKNSPMLEEMSKLIVAMQEDETLKGLQKWWGIGGASSDSCSSTEEPSHLRLKSFGGLFGGLCGAYVVCMVWRFSTKAIQSEGQICIDAFACARSGQDICQEVSSNRRSSRVADADFEHN